jgi:release factor glutamine methyltransferase
MPVLDLGAQCETESVGTLLSRATRALAAAGVETPGLDARRLLQAAAGMTAAQLISAPDAALAPAARRSFAEMLRRRFSREPVSRILGNREFYGRKFAITPAVLDPRPDSETLIEAALELIDEKGWRKRPLRILDVGTGSGCLLVTLLAECPRASGVGVDINAEALAVAAENARRHGVLKRMYGVLCDGLDGIDGGYDLVVCNLPYIPTGEIAGLSPEVRAHDPLLALDGGADGLDVFRKVIPGLARVVPGGWALFEVGAGQADAVAQLLRNLIPGDRQNLRYWPDLTGRIRCVAMEIQL